MSLKQKALTGIKWTSISSIFNSVTQFFQLAVLAHYLEPTDFGLMAIASIIIGFSVLFMDLGISASIIHWQNISYRQLSNIFWLNIFSSIFIFIIVYSLAPMFANFYNRIELISIIRHIAITFIISGIGNQYGVLLKKALKFNVIAKIDVASSIIGFIVAISLSLNNYGVYSLVYATVTRTVITTFGNIIMGRHSYKPSFIYYRKENMPMISFGMFQMGERSINYFNSQFDIILIGKIFGTEALGIYTIAKNLSMRPANIINPIITNVTFPIMAKIQDDTEKLKSIYLKSINYLASINFPIYILLALIAEPLILIIFGNKWASSTLILQILSLYGAIRSTGNPIGSLLLAKGKVALGFYWNLGLFLFIPVFIYVGSSWNLIGVAYGLLSLIIILMIPNWFFLVKPLCGAGFKEYFKQIYIPFFIAITGGVTSYGVGLLYAPNHMALHALVQIMVMVVVVAILNVLFNHEFAKVFCELLGRKKVIIKK